MRQETGYTGGSKADSPANTVCGGRPRLGLRTGSYDLHVVSLSGLGQMPLEVRFLLATIRWGSKAKGPQVHKIARPAKLGNLPQTCL